MLLKHLYLLVCDEQNLSIHSVTKLSRSSFQAQLEKSSAFFTSSNVSVDEYFSSFMTTVQLDSSLSSLIDNPFIDWYLVVPDHWVTKSTCSLETVSSHRVHALAGLALASETSHLPSEALCYHFDVDSSQVMTIQVCSLFIVEKIQKLLKKKMALAGAVTITDCLQASENKTSVKTFNKAIKKRILSTYQQKISRKRKTTLRWGMLFFLICAFQLSVLGFHYYVGSFIRMANNQLTAVQQDMIQLPASKVNTVYLAAIAIVQALPHSFRFTTFQYHRDSASLHLTGEIQQLNDLVLSWRSRWPDLVFETQTKKERLLNTYNHQLRTRSVRDVIVKIRKSTAEK